MTEETILPKQSEQVESVVETAPSSIPSPENSIPIPDSADTILPEPDYLESKPKLEPELPKPEIESSPVLPKESQPMPLFDFRQRIKEAKQKKIETRLSKIMDFVRQNGSITNDQIQKLLRVSDATASRYARILVIRNLLKKSGKTKSVKYDLV